MPITCGYCGDIIQGDTAKYDPVNKVYLHDGDSVGEFMRKHNSEMPSEVRGMRFPVGGKSAKDVRNDMRNAGTDKRLCAQYYKTEQAAKANRIVFLNKVSLKDLSD
jgi:hypothetical protein